TLVPANRSKADEQVEHLTEGDVERSNAAADRGRQGAFDADEVLAEGLHGVVGKPRLESVEALLTGVNLHPRDLAPAAVRLFDGRIQHAYAGAPDVRARAIAFDERDDRIVGDDEPTTLACDGRAGRRLSRGREMWHKLWTRLLGQVPRGEGGN